jgi:hypothetical protein
MSQSAGALWRRSMRRVTRRSEAFRARRPLAYDGAGHKYHCADCSRAWLLLCEAVRLANRLARVAA